ncbi:hypothetical protein GLW08_20715 [Pontibacillus yanchengensis]|uniref:Uncharacterized protein n=3 Tax=Pontibacillus yanchengensis TaxID=462910 RepID=A0ACC7VLP2_9BACI|nr:hypothetical protein [Pontibacillus yanchengensis]MYL55728.1 hypothetical protein [Pontibacillus yanchengensis]
MPTVKSWFSSNQEHVTSNSLSAEELEPIVPLIDQYHLADQIRLSAPTSNQYPELPRGCEVTSLSMLLQYHDKDVDKMNLAKQVPKDTTPYSENDGEVSFGNPNKGFVGSMYNLSKPGYGVYHEPIAKLTAQYVSKERVHDFSGGSFFQILEQLNEKRPVWVITNTLYKKLPEEYFETWNTAQGQQSITMKEHSVLVTGYDSQSIYFNDPLSGQKKKAPISDFREAWVQMGKQAISIK